MTAKGKSQLDRSGKIRHIYNQDETASLKGQSYVKEFVDSYDQALEKIKAYDDGLAVLSGEDYLKLVKKNEEISNFTVLINEYIRGLVKN